MLIRVLVGILVVSAAGCGRGPRERQYEEVVVRSGAPAPEVPTPFASAPAAPDVAAAPAVVGPVSAVAANSAMLGDVPGTRLSLTWNTPDGWREMPASGVRMATFFAGPENAPAECTITAFPGSVGGTQANLERWVGQLNVPVPPPAAFEAFMNAAEAFTSEGGLVGRLYDFADLLPDLAPDAMSMLAAVVERGESTIFVKMMGARSLLSQERARFDALCRSLREADSGQGGA